MKNMQLMVLLLIWLAIPVKAEGGRTMAVTIDDLPFVGYNAPLPLVQQKHDELLAVLRKHHVPAVGFVSGCNLLIPEQVDARTAMLQAWVKAGLTLGNHTHAHADLNRTALSAFQQDVQFMDRLLQWVDESTARTPRYFRFPMNHTGDTADKRDAMAAFLAGSGYTAVPFTVEAEDYLYAAAYAGVRRRGEIENLARLRQDYLAFVMNKLEFAEKLAGRLLNRELPQILLLHANELNADCLDEILIRLRARGYRFISMAEALTDPAYQAPDRYAGKFGPSWPIRWAMERGDVFWKQDPEAPAWVAELAKQK